MKYANLAAVEDIGGDEMTRIIGGVSFGEFNSPRVQGIGYANVPLVKANEEIYGVTNFGQLLQVRTEQYGLPGINGGIAYLNTLPSDPDIHVPPGFE